MKIINNRLIGSTESFVIKEQKSPNHSGTFTSGLPDTIVLHYTGGGSMEGSANWLSNPKAKASAHIVIGRNGDIIQLVPFNIIAWHAGKSKWNGRSGLNNYSIGIEIDNAGILEKRADGNYYTWFDQKIDKEHVVLATHKHEHNEKPWEVFPKIQIERVEEVCQILMETYNINELIGHDDIAPERKQDPGPAFPLQGLRNKILFGRKDEDENNLNTRTKIDNLPKNDDLSKKNPSSNKNAAFQKNNQAKKETTSKKGIVIADLLNIRSRPDIKSLKVGAPLPEGTKVNVLKREGEWSYVKVETEGWVNNRWLEHHS